MAGCGNTYRPVLATIGVQGPAGQPTKYAIVVSSPSQTSVPGPTVFVGSWSAGTTYAINQSVSYQGLQYVSLKNGNVNQNPVSSVGYWVQLANGLMTMVDFSGDTVLVTATVGVNPYYLALSPPGTTGYTLNSDKTVTSFDISTQLISSQVLESTLPTGTNPVSLLATNTGAYISDAGVGVNAVDQMSGLPAALKQELPVASGYVPLYMVGSSGAPRIYEITPATNSSAAGQVLAIEVAANTISATLPVGRGPVYGVMTLDSRRAFILNQTDGTVSVINAQNNALDQFQDSLHTFTITGFSITNNVVTFTAANSLQAGMSVTIAGLSTGTYLNGQTLTVLSSGLSSTQFEAAFTNSNVLFTSDSGTAAELTSTIPVGTAPVWADLASALNEVVVANEGNGTSPGSVSIVDISLCSPSSLPNNRNCDPNNPIDATTFGHVVATVPVGINPIMVSVLSDFTRAYVANAGQANLPCAANGVAVAGVSTACTVSVVNLTSNTVTATIPISGHPVYIATSAASPTGKVYVVCNDSQVMTVIKTDTDSVSTTIPLQGYGVSVRMTQP
jgi:DNA-binding beta-propeller fold protein YncE